MKTLKITVLALITLVAFSCSSDDDNYNNHPEPEVTQLKVIGIGTSVAQVKTIIHPETGVEQEAFCFLMDLIDYETGEIIGTLEDCDAGTTEQDDGSLISQITTTFNINGKGSIVSEGVVLQTPIGDNRFTTSFTPTENNIIDGTFDFEGIEGTTTLNGEIDLSQFDNNIIIFNCVFDIEFIN